VGRWLAANNWASAMIDTSDGLSTDLAHICKASGVGATIWAEKVPAISVPENLQKLGLAPLPLALHGGDDYELLFTAPPRMLGKLPRQIQGIPITKIGEITRDKRVILIDEVGKTQALQAQGWDPFRGPATKKKA
jgi:thiamine-monophosphate kinase